MARDMVGRAANVCTQRVVLPVPDGAEMTTSMGLDAEGAREVAGFGFVMPNSEVNSEIAIRKP
jgi:hypothetical protein